MSDEGKGGSSARDAAVRALMAARPVLDPARAWALRTFDRGTARRLRRMTPVSRRFGRERGRPVDRYYIEHYLSRFADRGPYGSGDYRGRLLEIGGDDYARRFGGLGVDGPSSTALGVRPRGALERVDIFDVPGGNPHATIVGDLVREEDLPADTFDCIICTQVLLVVYDFRAVLRTLHRALAPGGVLLMTNPGISRICRPDIDLWGDYWRFTSLSIRRLLEELFPSENVQVDAYGNVLVAAASLYGLASSELRREELDLRDHDYELIIGSRAVKPRAA